MKYIGLQSQIWSNNIKSVLLLIMFPLVFYALAWLFFFFMSSTEYRSAVSVTGNFLAVFPWITAAVVIWFVIAWFSHTSMINRATGSHTLERKENKRVYNLVENLCIAAGMKMPALEKAVREALSKR